MVHAVNSPNLPQLQSISKQNMDLHPTTANVQNAQPAKDQTDASTTAEKTSAIKHDPVRLQETVDDLNKMAEKINPQVRFDFYKNTDEPMIVVTDTSTNQVISTFPPEQILAMRASDSKSLLDKKV
jgi:flagellar protein FlaG